MSWLGSGPPSRQPAPTAVCAIIAIMPDDHIQRQMDFILTQQAQFASDMQLLKERQADSQRQIEASSRQIEANQRQIEANAAAVRQLVDVSMSLTHHAEETDQRLDALIDTVDKLVRRNGGTA
jgi:septal ring factor EnvC (AmiA/AmiB activator)